MSEMEQLGANLREAREYLGLTLEFVAVSLGMAEATIAAIEAGELSVGAEELEQLARLYRCSISFLRGREAMRVPESLAAAPKWCILSDMDRAAVLRFAHFLQHAGTASHPIPLQGEIMITGEGPAPLLRETPLALPPARKLQKMAPLVQEARTQQPLIWQSSRSFVYHFNWTLAAYSGCSMACAYCYVPDVTRNLPDKLGGWGHYTHVRSRCVELLTRQLGQLDGTSGFMSATTDPYQKAEGEYRLTRRLLETLVDSKMRFLLISTRGTLVLRDLDIFTDPRMKGRIELGISIPSNMDQAHAALEGSTPAFKGRFAVARKLRAAGVPVRIHAAPLVLHTSDFYDMVADCADWLWIDYTQHGAGKHPETSFWYYSRDEVQSLAERAAALPSLGEGRLGFGRDRFGWRWDGAERRIVAPPPRVQNPVEKRKGEPCG